MCECSASTTGEDGYPALVPGDVENDGRVLRCIEMHGLLSFSCVPFLSFPWHGNDGPYRYASSMYVCVCEIARTDRW